MSGATELTLTPESYHILEKVPLCWWDEEVVVGGIAAALKMGVGETRRRLIHLRTLGLIERRRVQTITPRFELRKVAKD